MKIECTAKEKEMILETVKYFCNYEDTGFCKKYKNCEKCPKGNLKFTEEVKDKVTITIRKGLLEVRPMKPIDEDALFDQIEIVKWKDSTFTNCYTIALLFKDGNSYSMKSVRSRMFAEDIDWNCLKNMATETIAYFNKRLDEVRDI